MNVPKLTAGFTLLLIVYVLAPIRSKAQFAKEEYNFKRHVTDVKGGLTEIYFVGTGDIQLALREGKDIAANTGLGVLFWRIWNEHSELQLDARINVASTIDTLRATKRSNNLENTRDFGAYMLAPATAGQGTFINTLWYINKFKNRSSLIKYLDGIQLSALASNQVWQLNTFTSNPNTGQDDVSSSSANVSIVSFRAGLFHDFMPEDKRRTKGHSIRLGINYNIRSIQGDLGREKFEDFRTELLGNNKRTYHGAEVLLSLRLKNIRADASLPAFVVNKKEPILGFSGVQFVTSISFVGGFPLQID